MKLRLWVRSFLGKKADTLGAKIAHSIIDKAILSVVILLIGYGIQNWYSEAAFQTELSVGLITAKNELISRDRQGFIALSQELSQLIDDVRFQEPGWENDYPSKYEDIEKQFQFYISSLQTSFKEENFFPNKLEFSKALTEIYTAFANRSSHYSKEDFDNTDNKFGTAVHLFLQELHRSVITDAKATAEEILGP